MMQKAIQDGAGGGHVAKEFAPFLERAVAGHDSRAVFLAAHHYFQEIIPGLLGQGFEAHVVDDDQVGLEIAAQHSVLKLIEHKFYKMTSVELFNPNGNWWMVLVIESSDSVR